jgi:hypothetical protein
MVLDDVVSALKERLTLNRNMEIDGRIESYICEKNIIDTLKELFDVVIPPKRFWYDCMIQNLPINIKLSDLKSADNISSKKGMLYTLTGMVAEKEDFEYMHKLLFSNLKNGYDYYFLIINKVNTNDIFWNSLKRIKTLVPNGNNLPFQCDWSKNRQFSNRTEEEASSYILNTYEESLKKRAKAYTSFLTNKG